MQTKNSNKYITVTSHTFVQANIKNFIHKSLAKNPIEKVEEDILKFTGGLLNETTS